ncbi:FixH family protein [Qipengyuania sp. SM2507]
MMKREFTGRHMTAVLVGGFGIVVAVNLYMASLATQGFGGVVVKNSYVASQKFNSWLDAAREQETLGWSASVERGADGRVLVTTQGVPAGVTVAAELRRPLGAAEITGLDFEASGSGVFVSTTPVAEGRWIVRVAIANAERQWAGESRIE